MTPLADRVRDRLWRLPAPTNDYTVTRDVEVPMRDGVALRADHYLPLLDKPKGTVLVRSPYGRTFPWSLEYGTSFAARGYHVVIGSVRGTFGSGGTFEPMVHEADDGADTAAWLRNQPWFDGEFATIGPSYLGFAQWALCSDPPPELRAAVVIAAPHDFATATWGTGAFTLNDFLTWTDMMAHLEGPNRLRGQLRRMAAPRAVARATAALPMGRAGRALLGGGGRWYESWLEHPDPDDEFWLRMRMGAALDRVKTPVLLIGGWRDLFADQTLAQYRRLHERGADVALTVGGWSHSQFMGRGGRVVLNEALSWIDTRMGGAGTPRQSPVRAEVENSHWIELPHWPPATRNEVLYPARHGRLLSTPPTDTALPSTFTFDPGDPTPTVGGRLLQQRSACEDSALAARDDVLTFTGEELTSDVSVLGTPVVEIAHSCDNPHRDLFVRLGRVDANGRSYNVSDGFIRLPTDSTAGTFRLELDATAHRFPAGSRIRLLIAGGCHPRWARNLGTGEPPVHGEAMRTATHTVHHGAGGISRVTLPVAEEPFA